VSWPHHDGEDFKARDEGLRKYWEAKRRGNAISRAHRTRVRCPHWVPEDLQLEFFERVKLYGEEAAAQHIRKLKREMERPYV
jgi:hypothetical protein